MFSKLASSIEDDKLYADDVFSTYLYTGNGSTQTINNGIDLAGKGGLVWIQARNNPGDTAWMGGQVYDTIRGTSNRLISYTSGAQISSPGATLSTFNSNGFTVVGNSWTNSNLTPGKYASWTFRKAPKFFDVVTYTGNGAAARAISHSLGQAPGMIIVKRTSGVGDWAVYHRSLSAGQFLYLNATNAAAGDSSNFHGTPTSSSFYVGTSSLVNSNSATYVAYLFAHDPSADGIIQCGSFTTDGSGDATVNLGWEPQYLMVKRTNDVSYWFLLDVSRGINKPTSQSLNANLSSAESNIEFPEVTATGFNISAISGSTSPYIYLAIRRPNKPPTSGTQVYNAIARAGTGAAATVTGVGFAPDLNVVRELNGAGYGHSFFDRLRGGGMVIESTNTNAEPTSGAFGTVGFDVQDGVTQTTGIRINNNGLNYINHFFRRAPGLFDVVCYTGTGVARTVPHSLGVAPELMIVRSREGVRDWCAYVASQGANKYTAINTTAAFATGTDRWNNTVPTASVFSIGSNGDTNSGSTTYAAYLFASLPGISKVGSYTGNGSSRTINCGFTAGARFFLCKRTDATGDWYVWDSARGIIAGNDPRLSLNNTGAEVTTDDSVDPYASGIIVNQVAATNINVNGATYIYLAYA